MENKEWFYDVYTRSTYKLDPKKESRLKRMQDFLDDENYCHILRLCVDEEYKDYQLTREETIHYFYCRTCIKECINNSMRYCSKIHCPYYFSYEEIINTRQPIERR